MGENLFKLFISTGLISSIHKKLQNLNTKGRNNPTNKRETK
jgi:hypothetical protein